MLEGEYQSRLIKKLKRSFPGCVVLKNDSGYLQGIPDLVIFHGARYAFLEVKMSAKSALQPNQDYYIQKLNEMSFAAFIYPSIEEEVFHALERVLDLS